MIILDVAIQYSTWFEFDITYSLEYGSINYIHWWFLMPNKVGFQLHGFWHPEIHQQIFLYGWSNSWLGVTISVLIGKLMHSWLMMHWLRSLL